MSSLLLRLSLLMLASAAAAEQLKWLPIGPSLQLQRQQQQQQQHQQQQQQGSNSKHWAVLIAGSSGWYNYRHQADICHAYQILRRHGVPEDQIITMMFDDIAHNSENPTPGKIVNRPNGTDVYKGVRIDYRGSEVTPKNFLRVLRGEGNGRVLKSGPDDYVFINFADHGGPGLIGFPSDVLKAKPLIEALHDMNQKKMYKRLVFYMEACESGSMFDKLLPDNIEIYATTAANSVESSYACYYDKERRTYLGDVYSVKWMQDSDAHNINNETLDRQFANVKEETNTSHVMRFGDKSLGSLPVSDFQGVTNSKVAEAAKPSQIDDAVSQRLVRSAILRQRIAAAATEVERLRLRMQLNELQALEQRVSQVFDDIIRQSMSQQEVNEMAIASVYSERVGITNFNCHHAAVDAIHQMCFNLGKIEESLQHIYKIVNLCESGISTARIVQAVHRSCPTMRI